MAADLFPVMLSFPLICLSFWITGTYELSCKKNPLIINVPHKLDFNLHKIASVLLNGSSPFVAVSGVALRVSNHLVSTITPNCAKQEGSKDHKQRY